MKKTVYLILTFLSFTINAQQIGDGYAPVIPDFGAILQSGVFNGANALGGTSDNSYGGWQHLFVIRHPNASNNHQFQLATSFAENDRLFFRKIATSLVARNPSWIELATRGANTFLGDQNIMGNLGIGTTTPSAKLSVIGAVPANTYMLIDNAGSGINYYAANNFHEFQTAGYTRFTINASGNVGVGTTAPEAKLDVNGSFSLGGKASNAPESIIAGLKLNMTDNGDEQTISFHTHKPNVWWGRVMTVSPRNGGSLGIGTATPDAKLAVKGQIHAQEVKVDLLGAMVPDYVFDKDYQLKTLNEVDAYIKANSHLPEVPSAQEIEKNGLQLGEMNMVLLKKIEELTLHAIEQQKQIERLKIENETYKTFAERLAIIEKELKK